MIIYLAIKACPFLRCNNLNEVVSVEKTFICIFGLRPEILCVVHGHDFSLNKEARAFKVFI